MGFLPVKGRGLVDYPAGFGLCLIQGQKSEKTMMTCRRRLILICRRPFTASFDQLGWSERPGGLGRLDFEVEDVWGYVTWVLP